MILGPEQSPDPHEAETAPAYSYSGSSDIRVGLNIDLGGNYQQDELFLEVDRNGESANFIARHRPGKSCSWESCKTVNYTSICSN